MCYEARVEVWLMPGPIWSLGVDSRFSCPDAIALLKGLVCEGVILFADGRFVSLSFVPLFSMITDMACSFCSSKNSRPPAEFSRWLNKIVALLFSLMPLENYW